MTDSLDDVLVTHIKSKFHKLNLCTSSINSVISSPTQLKNPPLNIFSKAIKALNMTQPNQISQHSHQNQYSS